jgi:hypothetical protein
LPSSARLTVLSARRAARASSARVSPSVWRMWWRLDSILGLRRGGRRTWLKRLGHPRRSIRIGYSQRIPHKDRTVRTEVDIRCILRKIIARTRLVLPVLAGGGLSFCRFASFHRSLMVPWSRKLADPAIHRQDESGIALACVVHLSRPTWWTLSTPSRLAEVKPIKPDLDFRVPIPSHDPR